MALWDRITQALALEPWNHPAVQTRSDALQAEIAALRTTRQSAARPWRPASIAEAMGVPGNFGAVTLISNVVGSLAMKGYQNGAPVADADRPRLIVRPNPLTTAGEFFRDTGYNLATRGEAWWKVMVRDGDGYAMSLYPIFPAEITTDETKDALRPEIRWRGVLQKNEDMVQMILSREPPSRRGQGPFQVCGAAVSVAVEAQEWAANFFADGGHPSIELHSDVELTDQEAADLREAWTATPANTPQVTSGGLSSKELGVNVPAAQMLDARNWATGDTARYFNIPGTLIEYAIQGSSLTYQTVPGEWDAFHRQCLRPNYLQKMEDAMSDLLPRTWSAAFATKSVLLADIKTRYEVHEIAIKNGIYGPEMAQAEEGYAAGDIEYAPVPFAPPQALPDPSTIAPRTRAEPREVRCVNCGKLVIELATPPYRATCGRCKAVTEAAA